MKLNLNVLIVFTFLMTSPFYAQEDEETTEEPQGSVIQTLTPSKLINKGQFDIKWFNNLYTQTKAADDNSNVTKNLARETFFTSTIEAYTGVSKNKRIIYINRLPKKVS